MRERSVCSQRKTNMLTDDRKTHTYTETKRMRAHRHTARIHTHTHTHQHTHTPHTTHHHTPQHHPHQKSFIHLSLDLGFLLYSQVHPVASLIKKGQAAG